MTLEPGSLILIDYTATIKDTGEIFSTTSPDEDSSQEKQESGPKLVSINKNNFPILGTVDDALSNSYVGARLTVEVPPEQAFGQRKPSNIRVIPLRKLGDDAERTSVGDSVTIDNKEGIVRFISSGRVTVDYNHKYAGKTLVYDITIQKSLTTNNDKIYEILRSRFAKLDNIPDFDLSGANLTVTIPEEIFDSTELQDTKRLTQTDIFDLVADIHMVRFIESFTNPLSYDSDQLLPALDADSPAPEPTPQH